MASERTDENLVLTRGAYERLKEEHSRLTTEGRRQVAERLQRARELGDLSENAEYDATKDDQGMLEARIRTIEHMLRAAEVVEAPTEADEVVPGIIVSVRDTGDPDAEPETYLVAASNEERVEDVRTVTVRSPLGQALLGRRPGERFTYHAPGGDFTYEVLSLRPWSG